MVGGGGIHLVEFAEFGKIAYPTSKRQQPAANQTLKEEDTNVINACSFTIY